MWQTRRLCQHRRRAGCLARCRIAAPSCGRSAISIAYEIFRQPYARYLIEIAAGWSILLVATGIYLWWPRRQSGGVVTVRAAHRKSAGVLASIPMPLPASSSAFHRFPCRDRNALVGRVGRQGQRMGKRQQFRISGRGADRCSGCPANISITVRSRDQLVAGARRRPTRIHRIRHRATHRHRCGHRAVSASLVLPPGYAVGAADQTDGRLWRNRLSRRSAAKQRVVPSRSR
ncbi:MAG: PepSY domain-containing protein [Agrobacterium sp.]|nr:PepSY domain-containing protein [Agrobacterium sp.]